MSTSTPDPPRRRPTIADVARRGGRFRRPPCRSRSTTGRASRRARASGSLRRRASSAGGRRPRARALTEARTRAIGLVLARDSVEQLERRPVLRALPVRDRARADGGRLRAAAAARARRRPRRCPPTSGSRRRGGWTASCSPTSRPATRASRCWRRPACRWCSRAGPRATCPFPWVETRHDEGMAPRGRAPRASSGHERIGFLGGRADFEHVQARVARVAARRWRRRGSRKGRCRTSCTTGTRRRVALLTRAADRGRLRERRARAGRRAARRASSGSSVPGDVSVIGFDDSPLAALALARADVGAGRLRGVRRGRGGARCWPRSAGDRAPVYSPSAPELVARASTARAPAPVDQKRDERGARRAPALIGPTIVDRVLGDVAEEVDRQRDARRPRDPAERVPEQERRPAHLVHPGQPRRRDPQARDPAAEEHRLRAVLGEERLAVLEHLEPVLVAAGPGAANSRRPKWRPIAKPTLSPRIAAAAATTISVHDVHLAAWASSAARDQRGLRRAPGCPSSRSRSARRPACSPRSPGCRSGRRTPGRPVCVPRAWRSESSPARARTRCPGFEGSGPSRSHTPWGEALVSRGTWAGVEVLHVSRHGAGPPAALQPRHPPREHRGAEGRWAPSGVLAVTVCGAVDPSARARVAGLLRRPALPLQPAARRLAVHVLHRAGRARARPLDLRGPVLGRTCARALLDGRGGGGRARCATAAATATSTARASTPRAEIRGLAACGRHRGVADRGPGDRAVRRGSSCPTRCSASSTDYANGVKDEATPVETLVEMMAASTEAFARVLRAALPHAAATAPAPAGRRLPLRGAD